MNYSSYENYKDSKVFWLGDIPKHWQIAGLTKYLDSKVDYRGKTPEKTIDGVFLVTARNIKNGKIDYELSKEYVDPVEYEEIMRRGFPKIGDVLFTTEAPLGETANVDNENVALAQRIIKFQGKNNVLDNYYLKYWIMNKKFQDNLQSLATGSTALGLKASKHFELRILLPSIKEQQTIASFLDYKTKQIDDLIAKKEELLKLLEEKRIALITQAVTKGLDPNAKMKPSGIDWLGDIPEHWKIKRLRFISKIQFSNVDKKTEENETEVLLCNYVDVYNNDFIDSKLDFMKATATDREIERFLVEKGDVIATKDSETPFDIAVPALVVEEMNGVLCGYHLAQIKPNKDILLSEYLFRLFQAINFNTHFIVRANGVTRFGIGTDAFGDAIVPIISMDEQKKIVEYIQNGCNKVDSLKKSIVVAIEKLKEYRTALITAAVTGKIDVRDFKPIEINKKLHNN